MYQDKLIVYRKVIVPWYDSETACYLMIVLMIAVILFAAVGISVAWPDMSYTWVPGLLLVMSTGVAVSASFRLARRYIKRYREKCLEDFSIDNLK